MSIINYINTDLKLGNSIVHQVIKESYLANRKIAESLMN